MLQRLPFVPSPSLQSRVRSSHICGRKARDLSGVCCKAFHKVLANCVGMFISALPLGLTGLRVLFFPTLRVYRPGAVLPWAWFCVRVAWRVVFRACPRASAVRHGRACLFRLLWRFLSGMGCGFWAWQRGQRRDELISANGNAVSVLVRPRHFLESSSRILVECC